MILSSVCLNIPLVASVVLLQLLFIYTIISSIYAIHKNKAVLQQVKIDSEGETNSLNQKIKNQNSVINQWQRKYKSLQGKLNFSQSEVKRLTEKTEELKSTIKVAFEDTVPKSDVEKWKLNNEESLKHIQELTAELKSVKNERDSVTQEYEIRREEFGVMSMDCADMSSSLESLEWDLEHLLKERGELELEIFELNEQLKVKPLSLSDAETLVELAHTYSLNEAIKKGDMESIEKIKASKESWEKSLEREREVRNREYEVQTHKLENFHKQIMSDAGKIINDIRQEANEAVKIFNTLHKDFIKAFGEISGMKSDVIEQLLGQDRKIYENKEVVFGSVQRQRDYEYVTSNKFLKVAEGISQMNNQIERLIDNAKNSQERADLQMQAIQQRIDGVEGRFQVAGQEFKQILATIQVYLKGMENDMIAYMERADQRDDYKYKLIMSEIKNFEKQVKGQEIFTKNVTMIRENDLNKEIEKIKESNSNLKSIIKQYLPHIEYKINNE